MEFQFFEDGTPGPITFDIKYLDALAPLRFPKLEYVSIYGTGEVIEDRLLECYAHEELETFSLQGDLHGTLHTFLSTVAQRCPKIRDLDLACDGSLSVKTHSFLDARSNLEGFSLPCSQLEWTLDEFKAVCKMSGIKHLRVPRIEVSWLEEIEPEWPVLDQFRTSISSASLEQLRMSAPTLGIMELRLQCVPSPSDVFEKLSRFNQLRSLELTLLTINGPHRHCINGQNLVLVARNCPELFKLHIFGETDHPSISGITDSFFENLASNLPGIIEFLFDVDDCSSLTFDAIYSMGKHCRKLWRATISCDIDWKHNLATYIPTSIAGGLFPTLFELELVVRGSHGVSETWSAIDLQNMSDFAVEFAQNAPELSSFDVKGGINCYEHIRHAFNKAIDTRDEQGYD